MTFGNYRYIIYIAVAVLLVLALFILYLWWKKKRLAPYCGEGGKLSNVLLISRRAMTVKNGLIVAAILLFGVVMLRPQWGEKNREVTNEGSDVLIALDVSRSMLAEDVSPNRLKRSKDAIRWIAQSMKGGRIGLLLFAGDAFLQCPLTADMGAFMMFLDSAGPDSVRRQGTDIGVMFSQAYRIFEKKRLTSKIMVLITDGEDHEGAAFEAMKHFKELGVSVYTVGVGKTKGDFIPAGEEGKGQGEIYTRSNEGKLIRTKKNESLLKQLAGATGGAYLDISKGFGDLRFILEIIEDQERNSYGSRVIKERLERFAPFALLLIFVLSIELMIPERGFVGEKRNFKILQRLKKISSGGRSRE